MDTTLDEGERILIENAKAAMRSAEYALDTRRYHTAAGYMDEALARANALIERRQRESKNAE